MEITSRSIGGFIGFQNFIADCDGKVDFVAIHGHTVFHQPDQQLTFQLGDGETLATYLTCPLVANFR